MNKTESHYLDDAQLNSHLIQPISGTTNVQLSPEDSQLAHSYLQKFHSIPFLSSIKNSIPLESVNQYQSIAPFNTNQQHLNSLAVQPRQFTAMGQQTQQVLHQPFIVQQQSGAQLYPPSGEPYSQMSQPQQQYAQSFGQQMGSVQQQSALPQSQYQSFGQQMGSVQQQSALPQSPYQSFGQQMGSVQQQSALPQSSQFPIFPSFENIFSLP
ncbi:unnamed protein product [Cercopithifilaria johnstoni]|uniref:Uncharacterized protein n=1 Tax=Cercopithifilaria johnstoni TaxID=2874296 RepID=A0A8J2M6L7_9BILA|nr:unnamed protein product [Cercopithifilaria johnstoni]